MTAILQAKPDKVMFRTLILTFRRLKQKWQKLVQRMLFILNCKHFLSQNTPIREQNSSNNSCYSVTCRHREIFPLNNTLQLKKGKISAIEVHCLGYSV